MVVKGAPALFAFCLVQIGAHLGAILAAGRLLGFSRRDTLIASNANVGGEPLPLLPCLPNRLGRTLQAGHVATEWGVTIFGLCRTNQWQVTCSRMLN